MRIVPICSSSKGNSTFIGEKSRGIVIDVGCSCKALCNGLALAGTDVASVKAILITHEHTDHVNGLAQVTKRFNIPVYAPPLTLEYIISHRLVSSTAELHTIDELYSVPIDAEITAFETPHDSAESVGYVLDFGGRKIGFCTDLGAVTETVRSSVLGCEAVVLESNYDISMLSANPHYPPTLKRRIAGDHGHLSNIASGEFASELVKSGTKHFILGHLSQENNTPSTAYNSVSARLSADGIKSGADYLMTVAPVMNTDGSFIAL